MKTVTVAAAKKDFSEIADRVSREKERYLVTRHGKPVLALVPVEDARSFEEKRRPRGLAAAAGLLADAPRFLDAVEEAWRSRARLRDRPAPRIS